MNVELQERWETLITKVSDQFNVEAELDGILLLIGIQELGWVPNKLSKDQKMDVMHIAICSLLSSYGYYSFVGTDEEGWPHWERNKKLPNLSEREQDVLIKEAVINYFSEYVSS